MAKVGKIAVRKERGAYLTCPLKILPWIDAESYVDFDTAINHGLIL